MTESATHLNLINHIDNRTGASVAMWAGVHCAPIEWGRMLAGQVSDDKKPMTGVWYRATAGGSMCKVVEIGERTAKIIASGGQVEIVTLRAFARDWELV